jgi:hypothetical protein
VEKDRWFRLKHDATGDVAAGWGGENIAITSPDRIGVMNFPRFTCI